ncbi:MAG: DUF4097 family beta strand repeat-containing protein [Lachnospiraceae bacterium]|nr:DUF4097 family beta strand repeat-containing protein [Lachnospiraceae bacterium]
MQKRVKGLLVAGGVLSAVGIGLFAVGAGMGGIAYVGAADLNKIDGNAKKQESIVMEKTKIEAFGQIKADLSDIDLKILPSEDQNYYMSYEIYRPGNDEPLEYRVENGTMKLSEHSGNGKLFQIDIGFISYLLGKREILDRDSEVVLYVPKNTVFEDSEIKIGDGDLEMEGFSGKNTELTLSYGDMKLRECMFENGVIASADGDMEASGLSCKGTQLQFQYGDLSLDEVSLEDCTVKQSDGDMEADRLKVAGNLELKNSYGDIELQLSGECRETLSMSLKTSYGEINVSEDLGKGGRLVSQDDKASYEKTAEAAEGMLKAELSDGDITLK